MDFKSALDILWRRRMVIATALVIGLVVAAGVFMITPTTYQATSSVMLVGVQNGRDPSMNNVDIPTLANSTSVLGAVQKDLKTSESIAALQNSITIKTPGWGVNVVPITFTDLHARTAVRGANAVATELSQFYRQISGARYQQLAQYLNAAMAQKRARLAELDKKLQTAAVADPYLDQANASSAIGADLITLERQRDQAQATMVGDRAQAGAEAQHMAQISPIARAEKTQSDPLYQNLRTQQAKDAAQLKTTEAQYSKSYPGLPGLRDTVRAEERALASAANSAANSSTSASPSYIAALTQKFHADATLAGDSARLQALDAQIAQAQSHLRQVPGAGVSVAALQRDRDAAQVDYQALSARLTQTLASQAEAASLGSVQIVDEARSAQSTVNKHAALLLGGAIVGFLVLGITLAFLLELTDSRLRTRESVEGLYGKPVLGTVGV